MLELDFRSPTPFKVTSEPRTLMKHNSQCMYFDAAFESSDQMVFTNGARNAGSRTVIIPVEAPIALQCDDQVVGGLPIVEVDRPAELNTMPYKGAIGLELCKMTVTVLMQPPTSDSNAQSGKGESLDHH